MTAKEDATPAMICYAAAPSAFMTDHAGEVAGLYDGFFFTCGDWDAGIVASIGVGADGPTDPDWVPMAKQNVAALKAVGVTENLLGICFVGSGEWPSPETLLSVEHTSKISRHFSALGQAAAECGFAGVSIDVEYPYPRYELDHPIYTYDGYTAGDLMIAAFRQGRSAMRAVIDEFPEAVVFALPGTLRTRPLERQFLLGMLDVMSEQDAPGGFHLGTEYSYCLHDPVTQAAIPRFEDCGIAEVVSGDMLDYWKRRCTVAPGVWPLHMTETPDVQYVPQPWPDELDELREQMRILRATSKRYIWSYSGHAVWHLPTDETDELAGRSAPDFPGGRDVIAGWHEILRDREPVADVRFGPLFDAIRRFDDEEISPAELCDAFGTPGAWWTLGPLGNPHLQPGRTASEALDDDIPSNKVYYGRDGAVRWQPWAALDPRGLFGTRHMMDYLAIDNLSYYFVCWIHSDVACTATLNLNWDDGIVVRVREDVVFDRPDYPESGHGVLYQNKYQFEERVPVGLAAGATRLAVTSINAGGAWAFVLRLTDADGFPLPGVRFSLSDDGTAPSGSMDRIRQNVHE